MFAPAPHPAALHERVVRRRGEGARAVGRRLAQVGVSIDYATPERHDGRRRLAGAFTRAWRAVTHAPRHGAARRQAGPRHDRADARQRGRARRAAARCRPASASATARRCCRRAASAAPPVPTCRTPEARPLATRRSWSDAPAFPDVRGLHASGSPPSSPAGRCRRATPAFRASTSITSATSRRASRRSIGRFGNVRQEPLLGDSPRMRDGATRRADARTAGPPAAASINRWPAAARSARGAIWPCECGLRLMRYYLIDKVTAAAASARRPGREVRDADRRGPARSLPDFPMLPGALIVEAAAQLAGFLLEMTLQPPRSSRSCARCSSRFSGPSSHEPVGPGDRLEIVATIEASRESSAQVGFTATVDGKDGGARHADVRAAHHRIAARARAAALRLCALDAGFAPPLVFP